MLIVEYLANTGKGFRCVLGEFSGSPVVRTQRTRNWVERTVGNRIKMEFEPRLWLQIKGVTIEEQVTWLCQSGHLGPPQATVIGSCTACDLSWPITVSLITLGEGT